MPRIALDIGPLKNEDGIRGIGRYIRTLSENLTNVTPIDVNTAVIQNYDIIHLTRFNPFRVSLPLKKYSVKKTIATIYDLIPLIYPEHYPPGIRGTINWLINNVCLRINTDAIITISETSKKDICRLMKVHPDKVHVTYLAAKDEFKKIKDGDWKHRIEIKYNLPKRFILYTGDINFNKNIPNLIRASERVNMPLVIAGSHAKDVERIDLNHPELSHLKEVSWKNVLRLGYVEDSDLVKIFNLATVYAQASYYEGFSLSALEAVSCGTPLAIAKNQCHVEIFGTELNYFEPNNIQEISEALLHPNINIHLPRNYSWKKTAEDTLKVYEEIC